MPRIILGTFSSMRNMLFSESYKDFRKFTPIDFKLEWDKHLIAVFWVNWGRTYFSLAIRIFCELCIESNLRANIKKIAPWFTNYSSTFSAFFFMKDFWKAFSMCKILDYIPFSVPTMSGYRLIAKWLTYDLRCCYNIGGNSRDRVLEMAECEIPEPKERWKRI